MTIWQMLFLAAFGFVLFVAARWQEVVADDILFQRTTAFVGLYPKDRRERTIRICASRILLFASGSIGVVLVAYLTWVCWVYLGGKS